MHACLSTAWNTFARASIGLVSLSTFTQPSDKESELGVGMIRGIREAVDLMDLVQSGMNAICFGENFTRNNFKNLLGKEPSELTAQFWQTLRHLPKRDDVFSLLDRRHDYFIKAMLETVWHDDLENRITAGQPHVHLPMSICRIARVSLPFGAVKAMFDLICQPKPQTSNWRMFSGVC